MEVSHSRIGRTGVRSMGSQKSRLGTALAAIYIFLVIIVFIVVYTSAKSQPVGSEFLGVYLLLVTLPWSFVIYMFLDILGIKVSTRVDIILSILFTITNAFIIYFIASKWAKTREKTK